MVFIFSFPVTLTPHDCRDIKWQRHRDYGIGDVHVLLTLNEYMYLNAKIQTNFRPQIFSWSMRYACVKSEVSTPFLFRENWTHGVDGQTDGQTDGVQHSQRAALLFNSPAVIR